MAEFNFYLSYEDTERVFALKAEAGEDDLTGNEYARKLLERELHRLHPERVERDDNGDIVKRKAAI